MRDLDFEDLATTVENRVRTIRLNRPKVLNALRHQTFEELDNVIGKTQSDGTRVLIITGKGDAFSSGGDIKQMQAMGKQGARALARSAHKVLEKMQTLPLPIIAAVNGVALGAGCDLALACDICLASERAVFGEPSSSLGIITPFGGTQRLPRILGPSRAKYMFYTGERIEANSALQMGLVNKVVAHDSLIEEANSLAQRIIAQGPIAIRYLKQLVNLSSYGGLQKGLELEMKLYADCFETQDQKEGVKAFLDKRKPVFVGR